MIYKKIKIFYLLFQTVQKITYNFRKISYHSNSNKNWRLQLVKKLIHTKQSQLKLPWTGSEEIRRARVEKKKSFAKIFSSRKFDRHFKTLPGQAGRRPNSPTKNKDPESVHYSRHLRSLSLSHPPPNTRFKPPRFQTFVRALYASFFIFWC